MPPASCPWTIRPCCERAAPARRVGLLWLAAQRQGHDCGYRQRRAERHPRANHDGLSGFAEPLVAHRLARNLADFEHVDDFVGQTARLPRPPSGRRAVRGLTLHGRLRAYTAFEVGSAAFSSSAKTAAVTCAVVAVPPRSRVCSDVWREAPFRIESGPSSGIMTPRLR